MNWRKGNPPESLACANELYGLVEITGIGSHGWLTARAVSDPREERQILSLWHSRLSPLTASARDALAIAKQAEYGGVA